MIFLNEYEKEGEKMEIYVELSALDRAYAESQKLADKLDHIQDLFKSTSNSLEWDVKAKANIKKYIDILNNEISNAQRAARLHSVFINDAREKYFEAERYSEVEAEKLKNDLLGGNKGGGVGPIPGPTPGGGVGPLPDVPDPGVGPLPGVTDPGEVGPLPGVHDPDAVGPLPGVGHHPGGHFPGVFGSLKSINSISSYIGSKMAKSVISDIKDMMLQYKNVPNLKYLSCGLSFAKSGISFGNYGYTNAVSSIVSKSYRKMIEIIDASIPGLMRSVLGYYPNWNVATVSYAGSLLQSKSSYSSSWTLKFSMNFSINF